jgi:hypothetical protein
MSKREKLLKLSSILTRATIFFMATTTVFELIVIGFFLNIVCSRYSEFKIQESIMLIELNEIELIDHFILQDHLGLEAYILVLKKKLGLSFLEIEFKNQPIAAGKVENDPILNLLGITYTGRKRFNDGADVNRLEASFAFNEVLKTEYFNPILRSFLLSVLGINLLISLIMISVFFVARKYIWFFPRICGRKNHLTTLFRLPSSPVHLSTVLARIKVSLAKLGG